MSAGRRLRVVVLGEPAGSVQHVLAGLARRGHDVIAPSPRARERALADRPHDARVVVSRGPGDLATLRGGAPALVVAPAEAVAPALRAGAAAVLLDDAGADDAERALEALLGPLERRALEAGAEASRSALLAALPVGVLLAEDGSVRAVNAALARRLGVEPAALEGRRVASLLHGDDAAEVERRARTGTPWAGVARLDAAEPVEVRLSVAPCGAGPPTTCWIVADAASDAARAARERAEDLASAAGREELVFLGSLVQSVVHDLRNPLQAALFGVSTLRAMAAGKAGEPLAMLERKVREIEAVLAELHEAAQPWCPVLMPFPLGELLEGARAGLLDAARERDVELRVEPLDAAVEVQVDPPRLKRALLTLAGIAVEASVPGAAVVMRAGIGADRGAWIEVLDERQLTPGGEAEFAAGGVRGSRRRLAIARRTIEAHGGVLQVEPRAPRGARARVELPAACVARPAAPRPVQGA